MLNKLYKFLINVIYFVTFMATMIVGGAMLMTSYWYFQEGRQWYGLLAFAIVLLAARICIRICKGGIKNNKDD